MHREQEVHRFESSTKTTPLPGLTLELIVTSPQKIICKIKGFVVDSRRWSKYSSHEIMLRDKVLRDKVKNKLCRMERMGTITTTEQPIKWVNPIFLARKPHREMFVSAFILLI